MALSDLQLAAQSFSGFLEAVTSTLFSATPGVGATDCAQVLYEQDVVWVKTASDVNATDATTEFVLQKFDRRCKIVSVSYVPALGGLNAANATAASLILAGRDSLNVGSSNTLATLTTANISGGGSGNWTQWVNVLWANVANAIVPADGVTNCVPSGGSLTFKITKNGAGTAVPGGTLQVRLLYF